jgi:hypothetical protein
MEMQGHSVNDLVESLVHDAFDGSDVESVQARWDKMFGEKEKEERSEEKEADVEEVKIKKPQKKRVASGKRSPEPVEGRKAKGAEELAKEKPETQKENVEPEI